MSEIHVLIVDDEEALVRSLSYALRGEGMLPRAVYSGEAALALLADRSVDVDIVLLDLGLPGMDGIATLEGLRKCRPDLPVIMISAHGDTRAAVQAVKGGATDYLTKPFELDDLLATIHNTLAVPASDEMAVAEQGALLGQSPAMRGLQAAVQRIANSSATRILLLGESGTGKTLVAQALHANSARSAHPFIEVNCAALPEQLIEAELFGSEKGSYTGAHQKRVGLVTQANNGTLFLDEIGELPLALQAKLLHFLENGSYRAVGASQASSADVRVVAATNRDLADDVRQGRFREDLFYRLNVLNLEVPPLRERGQDILLLARYFMQQACTQIQRPLCRLAPTTYPALLGNRWPGNVRQLQNVIFRAAAISENSLVDIGDLDIAGTAVAREHDGEVASLEQAVEDFERNLLEKLYASYPSTRQLASRLQTSHTAIAHRLRKYGISGKA